MKIRYYIILVLTLLLGFNKTEAQEYGGVIDIYTNGGCGEKIYVDDIYFGTSPLIVTLSFGEHKITAKRGGLTAIKRVLIAPTGGDTIVELKFATHAVDGVFSISSFKKVYFAKGNLQYKASTKTWRFAEHQWDIIGEDNKNISSSYDGWIDLFCWGTGDNPTVISIDDDYPRFIDWGKRIPDTGDERWFTLNQDEWEYVFNKRETNSGIRYAKANVNGVNGVILLPDDWSNLYYSLNNTNNGAAKFNENTISQCEWMSSFEARGAIFLPAAGYREKTDISYIGSFGSYWSASRDRSVEYYWVFFVFISDDKLNTNNGFFPYNGGRSVRLVREVE